MLAAPVADVLVVILATTLRGKNVASGLHILRRLLTTQEASHGVLKLFSTTPLVTIPINTRKLELTIHTSELCKLIILIIVKNVCGLCMQCIQGLNLARGVLRLLFDVHDLDLIRRVTIVDGLCLRLRALRRIVQNDVAIFINLALNLDGMETGLTGSKEGVWISDHHTRWLLIVCDVGRIASLWPFLFEAFSHRTRLDLVRVLLK